jgi:hypothetical protein
LKDAEPDFVADVMRDPHVWECVREDGVARDEVGPDAQYTYLRVGDAGFMMFRRIDGVAWEVHVALRRGAGAVDQVYRDCLAEMQRRGVQQFIAPIPEWNRAALLLARRFGFRRIGEIERRAIRDGKHYPLILMGCDDEFRSEGS